MNSEVNPMVREVLNSYLQKKKAERPGYSMRALARSLRLSPTFVHDILSGRKSLPAKHLANTIKVLDIDFETALKLKRTYVEFEEALPPSAADRGALQDSDWSLGVAAQREILRNWYFLPMLELMTLEKFDGDFCKQLEISRESADYGVKRLVALGLAEERHGKFCKTKHLVKFLSNVSQSEFRAYHKAMLTKSIEELEKTNPECFERRLITGATFTISQEKIGWVKERMAAFLNEIAEACAEGEGDQVYGLNLQFIPLSNFLPKSLPPPKV